MTLMQVIKYIKEKQENEQCIFRIPSKANIFGQNAKKVKYFYINADVKSIVFN